MNRFILFSVLVVVALVLSIPAMSVSAITSKSRSCDDNRSCVVTYKNGTQAVEISNAKWACIDRVVGAAISNTATNGPPGSVNFTALITSLGIGVCLKGA